MKPKEYSQHLPLETISKSPHHMRKETAERGLDDLERSIKERGLIHAVSVVERPEGNGYDLINGHRRYLAHRQGGMKTIRANVYTYEPDELADEGKRRLSVSQFLLAANSAEPLVPIERARYYGQLIDELGWDVEAVAKAHRITLKSVEDDLMFLNLDERVLDLAAQHLESFTTDSLRILAENATPSAKRAWMMTADEQVQVAEAIAFQTDKKLVDSPTFLKSHIREIVRTRRQEKAKEKRRLGVGGDDPVKGLYKLIDAATKAIADLTKADLSSIKEIDPRDKGAAYQTTLGLAQELIDFAEGPVMKLRTKGTAPIGEPKAPAAAA